MCPDLSANLAFLDQATALSESTAPREWQSPSAAFRHSSLGQHLRHTLEHIEALLEGMETGCIDYDARKRDEQIERQPELAASRCQQLRRDLEELGCRHSVEEVVVVKASSTTSDEASFRKSTLGREFQFLVSHTVHHFAIMAGICHGIGIETPGDFGIAPSTLKHRAQASS